MASFNRVILMGNTTRDIELRHTSTSKTPDCEVGLAVNDRRKNPSGEWVEETLFVDITFFGRNAEIASQYLPKGSPVLVEGRLKLDTWEKDGEKKSKMRVVCDRLQLLGTRGGAAESRARAAAEEGEAYGPSSGERDESEAYPSDSIPF
jgi:single-strand DNA-binding protein